MDFFDAFFIFAVVPGGADPNEVEDSCDGVLVSTGRRPPKADPEEVGGSNEFVCLETGGGDFAPSCQ